MGAVTPTNLVPVEVCVWKGCMLTTFEVEVVVLVVEVDTTGLPLAVFGCTICTGLLCGFCESGSSFGNGLTTEAFFIKATSAAVVVEAFGFRTGFFFGTAPVDAVLDALP